jgi:hypothetical protein
MAKPTQRAGQYGIETIKLAFGTAFATLMQLIQADTNKDKKLSPTELIMAAMGLGSSVMQLYPMWPTVVLEGGEIDPKERGELAQFIIDFELMPRSTRPEIEEQIDDTVYLVNEVIGYVQRTRARFPGK